MSDEVQLTPEARAAEEQWKKDHTDCQCWKCMYVTMPWVEKLDAAQREIEELTDALRAHREEWMELHDQIDKAEIPRTEVDEEFGECTIALPSRLNMLLKKVEQLEDLHAISNSSRAGKQIGQG